MHGGSGWHELAVINGRANDNDRCPARLSQQKFVATLCALRAESRLNPLLPAGGKVSVPGAFRLVR